MATQHYKKKGYTAFVKEKKNIVKYKKKTLFEKTCYRSDFNRYDKLDMTTILVEKINFSQQKFKKWQQILSLAKFLMATILNFAAKLFATELIATTCNDFLVVGVKLFSINFLHLPTTFAAAKNLFSCSVRMIVS
jgi:hypothetical protein